jgi:hypothetical protein
MPKSITTITGGLAAALCALVFAEPSLASMTPSSINFGNQLVGKTSAVQTITFRADAYDGSWAEDLPYYPIRRITTTGDFAVVPGGTCAEGQVITAHSTCTIKVAFSPVSAGTHSGTLTVSGTTILPWPLPDVHYNDSASLTGVGELDTSPPSISAPAGVTVDATSPQGAAVSYTVTASDNWDPNPSVSCVPASGSTFAIGTTTVNCTATDASGNSASASFPVTVKSAVQQISDLVAVIQSYNLDRGTENSLTSMLDAALKALQAGDTATACGSLTALINHAQAQSGKKLTVARADEIIALATRIRNAIGC